MPIQNLKSAYKLPVTKQYALGMAKIKKKASFFSKNPGPLLWWSSWKNHMEPCIKYLWANQATPSMAKKVTNAIEVGRRKLMTGSKEED